MNRPSSFDISRMLASEEFSSILESFEATGCSFEDVFYEPETESSEETSMYDQILSDSCESNESLANSDCSNESTGSYANHFGESSESNIRERITLARFKLDIGKDPYQWTSDEVKRWCDWVLQQCNIALPLDFIEEQFSVDGTNLCLLSREEFSRRAPLGGEQLFRELQLWTQYARFEGVGLCRAVFKQESWQQISVFDETQHNIVSQTTTTMTTTKRQIWPTSGGTVKLQEQKSGVTAIGPFSTMLTGYRSPWVRCGNPAGSFNVDNSFPAFKPERVETFKEEKFFVPTLFQHTLWETDKIEHTSSQASDHSDSTDTSDDFTSSVHHGKHGNQLWQFLKDFLYQPNLYRNCIAWIDRSKGIFRIEDSARVARLWGERKNRPAMNYDKLSRSIRQYYKKGIIRKTCHSKRLVYQFCPKYI